MKNAVYYFHLTPEGWEQNSSTSLRLLALLQSLIYVVFKSLTSQTCMFVMSTLIGRITMVGIGPCMIHTFRLVK
jgi:hypothetical protein